MFCKLDLQTWKVKWDDKLITDVFRRIINDTQNPRYDDVYEISSIEFEQDIIERNGLFS